MNPHHIKFGKLLEYLARVPAVQVNETPSQGFGSCESDTGWWVKFVLDIQHPLAWQTVQESGYVLNSMSLTERLPTAFKPVSPPPYLNGGPDDNLSWTIECPPLMAPGTVADWLEGRLPRPVDDEAQWSAAGYG